DQGRLVAHAGIVEEQVDATELGLDAAEQRFDVVGAGDVAGDRQRTPAVLACRRSGLLEPVEPSAGKHGVPACAHQRGGHAAADAGSRSGHQRYSVISHGKVSSLKSVPAWQMVAVKASGAAVAAKERAVEVTALLSDRAWEEEKPIRYVSD